MEFDALNEIQSEDLINLDGFSLSIPSSLASLEYTQSIIQVSPPQENNIYPLDNCYLTEQCVDSEYGEYINIPAQNESENFNNGIIFETCPEMDHTCMCVPSTGVLPSQKEYEGSYGFSMSLEGSKTWHYSEKLNKVFIRINKVLMIHFKTAVPVETGFFIRALLMFSGSESSSEPVSRCSVHAAIDDPHLVAHKDRCNCNLYKNVGHVIRSELPNATYCYNPESKRHSVLTNVTRLQPGADSISVPYIFKCQTTCSSIQRKPATIVFTLENKYFEVIGRKILNIKICSCPKRDKDKEEELFIQSSNAVVPNDPLIDNKLIIIKQEMIENPLETSLILASTSILPSQKLYEGPYAFNFSLENPAKTWHYSERSNKVFIKLDNVLMVHFKSQLPINGVFYVRALMMYSESEHSSEPVNRCTDHAAIEDPHLQSHKENDVCNCTNYKNVGHVIRSELPATAYCYDTMSKRHSVLNYWTLQPGSESMSIPYVFKCQTSCFSMQRRPACVVFTLEDELFQVYGRKVLEVKICTCPLRDKKSHDAQFESNKPQRTAFKRKQLLKESPENSSPRKNIKMSSPQNKMSEQFKTFISNVKSLVGTLEMTEYTTNQMEKAALKEKLDSQKNIVKENITLLEELDASN